VTVQVATLVADARPRVLGGHDPRIRGVVPVLETPFTPTGTVDYDGFLRVTDHVLGTGVSAVMFPGFASEFHKLSDDERWRLVDALLARAGDSPDVAVVISIPDHATRLAVRAVERAIRAGADAINVLPPHFLGPPASEVFAHLHAVLEAADPLPVIVQHAPSLTGLSLSTETLLALARKMPNLCAVKVESVPPGPMVTALTEADPPLATLVGYAGLHMLDAARRGAVGVQPGCSFPELYLRIWNAEAAGRTEDATALHGRLLPYLASWMQSSELIVQVEKTISLRRGLIGSDHCRRPGRPLDRVELESIDRFLEEFAPLLSGTPSGHPAWGLDALETAVFDPTSRSRVLDPACRAETAPGVRSRCAGTPGPREENG
jgi:4-hydroxy-tetrahydrodipicolinate synthase